MLADDEEDCDDDEDEAELARGTYPRLAFIHSESYTYPNRRLVAEAGAEGEENDIAQRSLHHARLDRRDRGLYD